MRGALLQIQRQFGHGAGGVLALVHRRGARVAGGADDFTKVTHAGVDGGDDAQRQVQRVEHRALFDVHFDKPQVLRRVALQRGNGLQGFGFASAEPGVLHGLQH